MIGYSRSPVEGRLNRNGIGVGLRRIRWQRGRRSWILLKFENMILPSSPIESVPRLPTEAFPDFSRLLFEKSHVAHHNLTGIFEGYAVFSCYGVGK